MSTLIQYLTSLRARYRRWAASSVSLDAPNAPVIEALSTILPISIGLWLSMLAVLVIAGVADYTNVIIALGANLGLAGLLVLVRRGYVRLGQTVGILLFWATITAFIYHHGSVFSVHLFGYVILTIVAAWVGEFTIGAATWLLSMATVIVLAQAEAAGLLPAVMDISPANLLLNLAGYLAFSVVVLSLARANATRSLNLARAEIAQRERAEVALRELNATLEWRVAERTRELSEREDEVRASETRYRDLYENAPVAYFSVGPDARIQRCNRQAAQMLGYTINQLEGRPVFDLYADTPYGKPKASQVSRRFLAGEPVTDVELQMITGAGRSVWVSLSVTALLDATGAVVESRSTALDITERKEAEALLGARVQARTRELVAEIAERVATQAALERSRASLAEAERIAHLGSWELDPATMEVRPSDELRRLYGFSPDAHPLTTADIDNVIHPDDRAAFRVDWQSALQSEQRYTNQYRIVLPGGETRVVHVSGEIHRDAAGQLSHVFGMAQDVTERVQAQAALVTRMEELSILEELGHPVSFDKPLAEIIHVYLEQVLALAHLNMARLYLLQEGRLHLAGVATDMAGEADARVLDVGQCLCGLAVQEGQPVYSPEIEGDPRCSLSDCHARGLHSLIALPLQSGEAVIGALVLGAVAPGAFADQLTFFETLGELIAGRLQHALLHREIQERAAGLEEIVAERTRELQTERDRTQAILETVGESVVVTDLGGRVLYANPATMTLTGASRDEVLGQPLWRNWSAHMLKDIWSHAREALALGRSWGGEVSGRRRDGSSYSVALTATPLYDESVATLASGAVWVQRDITSIREAERLKDQFVSNVSHELRTPISIIGLSCDNLMVFRDRLSESDRGQLLQDIHEQAHILGSLIEDILTLSQLDSGRAQHAWQGVDLARLVREQVGRGRTLAVSRAQQLTVSADIPVVIQGSPVQLQQVVRNLLDNAIKYTPKGGHIRCICEVSACASVAASAARSGAPNLSPGSWAVIKVIDNGIGIAADAIPLVFERFYRVHSEGEVPGTGLGLPIARELTVLHGGWITVTSTPGGGSTFTVYLPMDMSQSGEDDDSNDPGGGGSAGHAAEYAHGAGNGGL